jgi:hypothetical protein
LNALIQRVDFLRDFGVIKLIKVPAVILATVLIGTLLFGVFLLFMMTAGGDGVKTVIDLREPVSNLQNEAFSHNLETSLDGQCTERSEAGFCSEWSVRPGQQGSVRIGYRLRDQGAYFFLFSVPKYFLSFGPAYPFSSHVDAEHLILEVFEETTIGAERRVRGHGKETLTELLID